MFLCQAVGNSSINGVQEGLVALVPIGLCSWVVVLLSFVIARVFGTNRIEDGTPRTRVDDSRRVAPCRATRSVVKHAFSKNDSNAEKDMGALWSLRWVILVALHKSTQDLGRSVRLLFQKHSYADFACAVC